MKIIKVTFLIALAVTTMLVEDIHILTNPVLVIDILGTVPKQSDCKCSFAKKSPVHK